MSVISEDEMQEIVDVVWMTVLDLPVEPGSDAELSASDCITAEISISGAWQGLVSVRASEQFLTRAASLMFNFKAADVTEMDRRDTLRELTNMLGGTVKCLLPEPCDLSLPTIANDDSVDRTAFEWVNFSCEDKPLAIAIVDDADGALQVA